MIFTFTFCFLNVFNRPPKPVLNLAVDPNTPAQTLSGVVGSSEKVMTPRNPAPREMDACAQEHAHYLISRRRALLQSFY